jgi:dephospho-CoA kinase
VVPFVGLTGGVGAGKSTALAALERLGAAVLSTDAVVHELYLSDELRDAVRDRWGPEMLDGDGHVDRSAVAGRAFASDEDRGWLEGELWPRVGMRVAQWREDVAAQDPSPPAGIVEVPLLFEAGMDEAFDATIAVISDEEVRRERAGARGHAAVDERVARQLSQDEKAQRATYVVVNDGSVEDLERKLSDVLAKLRG